MSENKDTDGGHKLMIDEKTENKDIELDTLLNDALNDFDKSLFMPTESQKKDVLSEGDPTMNKKLENFITDPALLENLWNEPTMKEAMSHFENSIRSVFNSSDLVNRGKEVVAEPSDGNGGELAAEESDDLNQTVDIDSLIENFRKMAKMTAETFSKDGNVDAEGVAVEGCGSFSEQISKNFIQVAQKLSSTVIMNEDYDDNSFHNMVSQTIKSLSDNNNDIEGCFNMADCSEELGKLIKGIESNETVNKKFFKFMRICMKTIKFVVYPSLKDLCEKYPIYITNKKSTLSESEMANYEKQYQVMDKICKLFEADDIINVDRNDREDNEEIDNRETDKLYKKFLNILTIMKDIQDCGQIPQELVTKRPKIFDDLTSEQPDSKNCSIS